MGGIWVIPSNFCYGFKLCSGSIRRGFGRRLAPLLSCAHTLRRQSLSISFIKKHACHRGSPSQDPPLYEPQQTATNKQQLTLWWTGHKSQKMSGWLWLPLTNN